MDILSAKEAAAILHLNLKRVQHLARSGQLPAHRVGRKWLFHRAELEQLLGRAAPAPGGVELSARNQLRARITEITIDGLMAEVRLAVGDQEITSIITRSSVERLHLAVGSQVFAVIKATEVMVGVGTAA